MTEIFAQGDLLLERVADVAPSGTIEENTEGAAMVLAEGEESGHRHAIRERVTMFHDDSSRGTFRPASISDMSRSASRRAGDA